MLITRNGIIKTNTDYEKSLLRLDEIFDAPVDLQEGDEAELLVLLIENFEDEHYPISAPDPIAAIIFHMEQLGMKKKDLAKIIGYRSRVSEILSKRRRLSMIRNLHEKLNIPYESLVADY